MKKLVLIISLAIVAISCGEKKEQKSELTGSISIDGSGTVFPVSEAVAEEFLKVLKSDSLWNTNHQKQFREL